jgi:hypothetical protein
MTKQNSKQGTNTQHNRFALPLGLIVSTGLHYKHEEFDRLAVSFL